MSAHPNKITILYIIPSIHCGGAEINALRLLCTIDRQRFNPIAMIPKKGPLSTRLKKENIPLFISGWPHHFSTHSAIEKWVLTKHLSHFLKKHSIDLIHNNSMLSLDYATRLSKKLNKPLITHWHDDRCPDSHIKLLQEHPKMPLIAVSNAVKKTLQQKLPHSHPITVIYNGIDTNTFYPKNKTTLQKTLNLPENGFYIGFCSRITEKKGLHILLNALSHLPSPIQLVVAGYWESDRYKKKIHTLISENSLTSRVHFFKFQPAIAPIIQACDLLAIPSETESFSLITLEGMACKKPVLCHKVGGLPELVEDNLEGFHIKKNDTHDWHTHIKLLYDTPSLYKKMASAALEKSKKFTLKSSINAIETLYIHTLNPPSFIDQKNLAP